MRCNDAGIALIKSFEGCALTAYRDSGGILTIGWGHTGPDVKDGLTWTQMEADNQFLYDLTACGENPVNEYITAPLGSNQFSALCSLVYNIGAANFEHSTLRFILDETIAAYAGVPEQILKWDHVVGKVNPGLLRRRQAEVALWDQPDPATS